MKKLVVLIMVSALIFSLFTVPSVSAIDASLSFDKEVYEVYVNETVQVTILLNTTNPVGALQFNVTWDPEYLEFINYTVGDAGASAFPTINDQHVDEGYIRAGFMNFQGISSGELLVMVFRAKKDGNTELRLNIEDATDTSANPIEAVGGTATVTIQKAVIANFTFSPTEPAVGQEVTFDASSSQVIVGTITEYSWSFGDGKTASGKIVTHKYLEPGVYNVTLTVTGDQGTDSITKQIEVINHPPNITSLTCSVIDEDLGKVQCTAQVSDPDIQFGIDHIVGYIWDFGDEYVLETNESTVTHEYAEGGTYTISLIVYDYFGEMATSNTTVQVHPLSTVQIENITPAEYEMEITDVEYSQLPLEYNSAFEFVNESVTSYVSEELYEELLNESNKFINDTISEYLSSVISENLSDGVLELLDYSIDEVLGEWNLTLRWTRESTIIGWDINSTDRLRLIIKENRIVDLKVAFPPILEENIPLINITSPVEKVYNVTTIPIKVNITDDSIVKNVTAFIDGKEITLTFNTISGLYEAIASNLINGSHVLKVYARDEYGNLGVAEVYFFTHEAAKVKQVQVGNNSVTVGVIGNATVMSTNETIVVNATVDGTEVTVEIPVAENVTSIVVNTTAIENVVRGEENATLIAGWNATIAGEPEVIPTKEEEMQDGKKIIKEKVAVKVNVIMGEEGLAVLAIPIGNKEITMVKTLKENGTEIELTTNRSAEIGYYYVENGILFVVLKKDPTVIVEAEKSEEIPVQQATWISEITFLWRMLYIKYSERFDKLYNESIERKIDNETLQEALHYKQLSEQYYEKAEQYGPIIRNLNNPKIIMPLRRAYLNIKKAVEILEKAIEEAGSS